MSNASKLGINKSDFRLVFGSSHIDYDLDKDDVNRKKHGYSLESAVYLLERWMLPIPSAPFITSDPISINDEVRYQHMGVDDEKNIVFIVTTMRPNETIRVISFRRASENERDIFTEHTGYNKSLNLTGADNAPIS